MEVVQSPSADTLQRQARLALACRKFLWEDDPPIAIEKQFCQPRIADVCRTVLHSDCRCDRAPDDCRLIHEIFRCFYEIEHKPGANPIKTMTGRVRAARKAGWHVAYLEGCSLLAKLLRSRSFDVIASLHAAQDGIEYAATLEAMLEYQAGLLQEYLPKVRWSLRNAEIWPLIYARQFQKADERIKGLRPGPQAEFLDFADDIAAFLRAYDGDRDFISSVVPMLKSHAVRMRANVPAKKDLADHLDLYRGFALALNQPPHCDDARKIFAGLGDSTFTPAKIYSRLGLALCDFFQPAAIDVIRQSFAEYRRVLEEYAGANNMRFKRYDYPYFYLQECRIAAFCDEGDTRTILEGLRKRVYTPLRNLESFNTLEGRMAYAPQVRQFYEVMIEVYLRDKSLAGEKLIRLANAVERSRRIAIMPWYGSGKFGASERDKAAVFAGPLQAFNAQGERPAEKILAHTAGNPGSMAIFLCMRPQPLALWFLDGKPHYRVFEAGDPKTLFCRFVEENKGCLAQAGTPVVYLFCDDDLFTMDFDVAGVVEGLGGNISVYWCGDMIRLARKMPLAPPRAPSCLCVYDSYPDKPGDRMDSIAARQLVVDHCGERNLSCGGLDAASLASGGDLFAAITGYDAIVIFAHGEAGKDIGSARIRFSRFSIGLQDLYACKDSLKNKSVCLCSCSTGAPMPGAQHEVLSLGNVMVSADARMVYCPLKPFDQREFEERVGEFLMLVEGKGMRAAKGWRVVV